MLRVINSVSMPLTPDKVSQPVSQICVPTHNTPRKPENPMKPSIFSHIVVVEEGKVSYQTRQQTIRSGHTIQVLSNFKG